MDAHSCNLRDCCQGANRAAEGCDVDVIDDSAAPDLTRRQRLVEWTRGAMSELAASGEVRVRIVNDTEMARLHERHTGIAGTTDVLTFDLRDAAQGPLDTDLVVCIDEAHRQAASRGVDVEHELLLYIIHGILHCFDHDDHDDDAASLMHETEDRVLAALGLDAVYRRPARPEAMP